MAVIIKPQEIRLAVLAHRAEAVFGLRDLGQVQIRNDQASLVHPSLGQHLDCPRTEGEGCAFMHVSKSAGK